MKHSPGPWHRHNNAASIDEICTPNGDVVCYPEGASEADKDVIAAAPRMLELLRELEWSNEYDSYCMRCPECGAWREATTGEPRPGYGLHDKSCKLGSLLTELGADK